MIPAAAKIAEWRDHPERFVREALQATPDGWQVEVLEAVRTRNRLALKASKGPGKSTLLAWIGWWFLLTRQHPKVLATSITGDNLRDGLWAEMAKWQHRSRLLSNTFTWSAERIVANDHPKTWWASARTWPKGADASQQANTLAGVHADNVLFLVDEAGGIPDAVVATAEAGLANADPAAGREAKLLIAGNPTHLEGPLYRACTSERALWYVYEISGDPDDPKRAPRVSVAWAREQIQKYGREHPYVLVNVLGRFPPGQSNKLIGVNEASAAAHHRLSAAAWSSEVKIIGVDVARFGDDRSVLQLRQGKVAFKPKVWRNLDTQELAGQVALVLARVDPDATFIDEDGIGAGVIDRLRVLGYPIIGVHSGARAMNSQKFADKRAEMWWAMADWLRGGAAVPDDGELLSELTAPTYKFDAAGRVRLESKEDLKKRGLASPDKADALAFTFFAPVAHRGLRAQLEQKEHQAVGGGSTRSLETYDPFGSL